MNSSDLFEALVNDHYEALYRFALSLTGSESDARDLTQQTFYIWASKGSQLRDISKAKTWLFTTLHRAFLGAKRKEARFPQAAMDEEQLPVVLPECARALDSAHLLDALAGVDGIYQAAVALFYLRQHDYQEIAVILAVPVGTVKSRIARGIQQLRKIFMSGELFNEASAAPHGKWDLSAAQPVESL